MSQKIVVKISGGGGDQSVASSNGESVQTGETIEEPLEIANDLSSLIQSVSQAQVKANQILTKYVEQHRAALKAAGKDGGSVAKGAKVDDDADVEQNYMEEDPSDSEDEEQLEQPTKKSKNQV